MIDAQWNHTLHRPIHVAGLYLNPSYAYSYGFRFDREVMSGFYECVQRMVLDAAKNTQLSQELEMYKIATGLFGFDTTINDRSNPIPSELHLFTTSKFKNSISLPNCLF